MIRIAQILGKMNGGGVEQMVMNVYRAIDRTQVQFDFYIFKGSTHVPIDEIKALGGRIFVVPKLKHPAAYYKSMKKLLGEGGYTIAHCHLSTLSGVALLAAKNAGIPVRILHNHSTSGGMREILRNVAKAALKPFARAYATDRLACSQYAARWMYGKKSRCTELRDPAPPKACVRIMRNAVDTQKFAFDPAKRAEIRKAFHIPQKTLLYGHIGRFCPQKNQMFLLDIFTEILKQHKNSMLMLVGEGPDKELITARVIAAKLQNRVIFTGQRNDADKLYSAFDCFIMPSQYEGLPVVGVEAQCAGLYCVFSDKITPEVNLTDGAHSLTLKDSAADWACAALCCANVRNEHAAEQLAEKGYEISQVATDLLAFYQRRFTEAGGEEQPEE